MYKVPHCGELAKGVRKISRSLSGESPLIWKLPARGYAPSMTPLVGFVFIQEINRLCLVVVRVATPPESKCPFSHFLQKFLFCGDFGGMLLIFSKSYQLWFLGNFIFVKTFSFILFFHVFLSKSRIVTTHTNMSIPPQ